ncbi:MAG: hypothetical protein ACI81R_000913 [Bradymonadia bacterium]|jgi:hypothetical protein
MLDRKDAGREHVFRVARENRDALLVDDRSAVDRSGNHEVHARTGHRRAGLDGLLLWMKAGERGQQARMNVHDAAFERPEHFGPDHSHVSR